MSWLLDFLSHGGEKLFVIAIVILFHFAKTFGKRKARNSPSAPQNLNGSLDSAPDFKTATTSAPAMKSAFPQKMKANQSVNDASPWSSNQNPFESSTKSNL